MATLTGLVPSFAHRYGSSFEGLITNSTNAILVGAGAALLFTASLRTTAHGKSMGFVARKNNERVGSLGRDTHYRLILFYASAGGLPAALELRKIESCDLARPAR